MSRKSRIVSRPKGENGIPKGLVPLAQVWARAAPSVSSRLSPVSYAVTMASAAWSLSFSTACSRILYLRILPAAFMGKESTKST